MRIATSADWRQTIPFETPLLAADVAPGDPSRCAGCPAAKAPYERTELWAVKHRHPNNHDGFVRFYCAEHRPEPAAPAPAAVAPARAGKRASTPRPAAEPRVQMKPSIPERQRAVCPTCFLEANANGVCGSCGETVG